MRGLQSFRWPVKLAMLVIALLAVIAIGSGWWLPWDPAAIDLQQRLLPPGAAALARHRSSRPGYFLTPAGRHPRFGWGR